VEKSVFVGGYRPVEKAKREMGFLVFRLGLDGFFVRFDGLVHAVEFFQTLA